MDVDITIPSDGLELSAVLHVPDAWQEGERRPGFIVLHGFAGTKDNSRAETMARMFGR
jgi:hypothetical protein